VILDGVPRLEAKRRDEATCFTTLIDALYEHRVDLICAADAAPHELYTEGTGGFAFPRTVSRLMQMQAADYMGRAHVL
jgi:cell division protein ZapE